MLDFDPAREIFGVTFSMSEITSWPKNLSFLYLNFLKFSADSVTKIQLPGEKTCLIKTLSGNCCNTHRVLLREDLRDTMPTIWSSEEIEC